MTWLDATAAYNSIHHDGQTPFTGLDVWWIPLIALLLITIGIILSRRAER